MSHLKINSKADLLKYVDEYKYGLECPRLLVTSYFDKLRAEVDYSAEKIIADNSQEATLVNRARLAQIEKLYELEQQCLRLKIDTKITDSLTSLLSHLETDLSLDMLDQIYNEFCKLKKYLFLNQTILFSNKLKFKKEGDLDHGILVLLDEFIDVDYLEYHLNLRFKNKVLTNELVKLYHIIDAVAMRQDYIIELNTEVFNRVESMTLFYRNLVGISEHAFKGFDQLQTLELNQNLIKSIHSNAFSNLANLEELSLEKMSYCLLESLDSSSFDGLSSLKSLSMTDADFIGDNLNEQDNVAIRNRIFVSLPNLEFLHFSYNNISYLDCNIFISTPALKELHLAGNKLASLDATLFASLINLETLYLNDNQLRSIAFLFESNLKNLREFSADSNRIEKLEIIQDSKECGSLASLIQFSLASNAISRVEENYFTRMPNLVKLSLFDNRLKSVEANTFAGLVKLKTLELGNNFIEDVESSSFDCLNELEELDLFFNENIKSKRERLLKNLTKLINF